MLTPRARCRPPRWKSLNQEEPTSGILCRLTGTDHRLQPTHRYPARAPSSYDGGHLTMRRLATPTRTADSPARPAPPRERPVKGDPSVDAGHLKRYRDALHAFAPARPDRAPHLGGIRARSAHPFACSSPPFRVSRGVSALGRARSFGLGPTRPGGLATAAVIAKMAAPGEPDQRCVRSVSASQHSVNEHPHLRLLPVHRHRLFAGRALDGVPPIETGDPCGSRRTDRFGGSRDISWGACSAPHGAVRPCL